MTLSCGEVFKLANNGIEIYGKFMNKITFKCKDITRDIYISIFHLMDYTSYLDKFIFGLGNIPPNTICNCEDFMFNDVYSVLYMLHEGREFNYTIKQVEILDNWCLNPSYIFFNQRYRCLSFFIRNRCDTLIYVYENNEIFRQGLDFLIKKNIISYLIDRCNDHSRYLQKDIIKSIFSYFHGVSNPSFSILILDNILSYETLKDIAISEFLNYPVNKYMYPIFHYLEFDINFLFVEDNMKALIKCIHKKIIDGCPKQIRLPLFKNLLRYTTTFDKPHVKHTKDDSILITDYITIPMSLKFTLDSLYHRKILLDIIDNPNSQYIQYLNEKYKWILDCKTTDQ